MVPGAKRSAARELDEERPLRRRLPEERVGGGGDGVGGWLATVASSTGAGSEGAVALSAGAVAEPESMVSSSSPVAANGAWHTGHDSQGVGCS
jgi:hypothetical protein